MAVGRFVILSLLVAMPACRTMLPEGAEAFALNGRVLVAPILPDDVDVDRQEKLAAARAKLASDPDDRDAWIWVGRRLGYLGRYRDAIDVYTEALGKWPSDPFLLRHRGHRWISVREFERASDDLSRAADACREVGDEVEPDGLPVPNRPPHSSLHFNVYYHLGLASFVSEDRFRYYNAQWEWLRCLAVCDDDESRVAVTHWLWCAFMRCGDLAGAAAVVQGITEEMDVVENTAYHQLCLLYKGERTRDQLQAGSGSSGAALRFGLAHHELVTGDRSLAKQQLQALANDPGWASFGVIAAEAELARW